MDSYEHKYLKYKNKYIALRKLIDEMNGGSPDKNLLVVFQDRDNIYPNYTLNYEQTKRLVNWANTHTDWMIPTPGGSATNIPGYIIAAISERLNDKNVTTGPINIQISMPNLFYAIDRMHNRPQLNYFAATGRPPAPIFP